jgi:hypothetical protein
MNQPLQNYCICIGLYVIECYLKLPECYIKINFFYLYEIIYFFFVLLQPKKRTSE